MFGLTEWRQTKFYQEVEQEVEERTKLRTKLEAIPRMLKMGLSLEQIAQALELEVEDVRKAIENQNSKES